MSEPGLDRHEWESEWASLEEDIADSPAQALPYVHELLGRMLVERGVLTADLASREGADPELLRPWEAGGELVRRLADGLDVDPEDLTEALENYRLLFETLLVERAPP